METATSRAKGISNDRKKNYLKAMSEDKFRDKIVRPLMFRLGYKNGRDLCGPDEEGKDAIFAEETKFGTLELTAVQTKKGNVNMSQTASANLINAITQLRTALDTPVSLIRERKSQKPSRVILCASGSINAKARSHIVNEVDDDRISFLDAEELIDLIDENYPEVWFGIETDLIPYFKAIQALIEGGVVHEQSALSDPAQDLLQRAATDERFVPIKLFRTYNKLKKTPNGAVERQPSFEEINVDDLLNIKNNKILILGEGGSGKSTAVKRLAYQYAKSGIGDNVDYKIPIVIPCTDIMKDKNDDLLPVIEDYCRRVANTSRACFTKDDLEGGRILLCADALDEVANTSDRIAAVEQVCSFQEKYPKNKVIITSRMYSYLQEIEQLSDFARYTISPIGLKQAAKIVDNVQSANTAQPKNSKEILRRLESVHGIELSPLLVTVFAATSEYDKSDIPANITELFKKFTELMLGRWDESKGLNQQYQAPLKDFICQCIAFEMHSNEITRMSYSDLSRLVRRLLEERGYKADAESILSEITERSGIFRRIGESIEFRHHLLQEFFAGLAIPNKEFLEGAIGEDWWARPIVFYFGDNPSGVDLLHDIATDVLAKPEMLFVAGTTIGLALQACYLSKVEKKIELWKLVCLALSISTTKLPSGSGDDAKYPLNKFIIHYLMGRDAVALNNLKQQASALKEWWGSSNLSDQKESDAIGFWVLVGLIEIGAFDDVRELLADYDPRDGRYLLAIYMGCFLSTEVRAIDASNRAKAGAIVKDLAPRVEALRREFLEEFKSELLEIRKGKIEEVGRELE